MFATHKSDVIMSVMSLCPKSLCPKSTVCLAIYLGEHQTKYQNSRHWSFVKGIHRWPVDSPHKGPVTQKAVPFHDIIMYHGFGCIVYRFRCSLYWPRLFKTSITFRIWISIFFVITLWGLMNNPHNNHNVVKLIGWTLVNNQSPRI